LIFAARSHYVSSNTMLDFSSYEPSSESEQRLLNKAEELFLEGYKMQCKGRLEVAIALYRGSLQMHPTAEAHTFLGWTYGMQGKFRQAIDECKRAIEVDPNLGNPYNDIGSYLMQQGHYDEAEQWFKRALGAPRYECYHYAHGNLAQVLESKFDIESAIDHYRLALKEEPEFPVAQDGLRRLAGIIN
jgi:tetratricopeptide (TPR) repeat protein